MGGLADLTVSTLWAALRSIGVAVVSTMVCLGAAVALAVGGGGWGMVIATLPVAASALVLGTGLYLILFPWISPGAMALPVTMLMNALFALPFAMRIVAPAVAQSEAQFGRQADLLGLNGLVRLRVLTLPRIRGALGFAAGLAAALSMGDLGVIALFASDGSETLPLHMVRLRGAYRSDGAEGAALVLLVLSLGLFWAFDRMGRRRC